MSDGDDYTTLACTVNRSNELATTTSDDNDNGVRTTTSSGER